MNVEILNFDKETLGHLRTIQLKIELLEKKRVRIDKTLEELLFLLKSAENSNNEEIQQAFANLVNHFDAEKYYFFKALGINVGAYAGNPDGSENSGPSTQSKAKKKIIYRGQERWT